MLTLECCRKDEGWQLSRGVYACVGVGLLLLLGAISAVIATINPWMVSERNLTKVLLCFALLPDIVQK